jgi:trigger factor
MKQITTEITKLSPCKLKLKIFVGNQLVEQIRQKCLLDLQKEIQMPGFRKGTVPIELINKQFPDLVKEQLFKKIVQEILPQVFNEHKINYIPNTLKILSFNLTQNNDCIFEIEVEVEPEVKLKSYKGLKLVKEVKKVSQADIDKTIQELQERNAKLVPSKKEKIESQDITATSNIFCVINYKIFIDGKELKNYEGKNVLINLSLDTLPKGLKEGLVGMSRGEKKNIEVEFPVNISDTNLMGKQGVMEVELVEIKEKQLPNVDNEFAKDLGYKDLDELISDIRQHLQAEFDRETEQKLRNQIYEILLKEHNFAVPESEVEERYNELLESLKREYARYNQELKLTEEQQKQLKRKSEEEIRLKYILKKILETENIQLTKELLEKERGKLLSMNPGREKEVNEYFEKNFSLIASNILEDKIFELIISNAKIKEVDATKR